MPKLVQGHLVGAADELNRFLWPALEHDRKQLADQAKRVDLIVNWLQSPAS
jgi:hypothetical protein